MPFPSRELVCELNVKAVSASGSLTVKQKLGENHRRCVDAAMCY